MATTSTQVDRTTALARVLDVLRALLTELGSAGAVSMLGPNSQFDRDLGLGSLERVELLARLEAEFSVRLPDRVASEVNSAEQLAAAVLAAPGKNGGEREPISAWRASAAVQTLEREAVGQNAFAAQTLIEVLRFRAQHDAQRQHLQITEDSDVGEKAVALTFSELYEAAQRCAAELARRGVPPGGRVSLMLPTSRAFFVSFAGILLAGALVVAELFQLQPQVVQLVTAIKNFASAPGNH